MQLRRLGAMLAIAGVAALAASAAGGLRLFAGVLGQLELETLDYRVRMAADPPGPDSEVVLVLFDSTSVESWPYLSPFPRTVLADLIDIASTAGAKAIGLDVHLDRMYPQLDVFGAGDDRLRESIRVAGNVILVGATTGTAKDRTLLPPHPDFASEAAGIGVADLPTPFETVRDAVLTVNTDSGRIPGFALALYAHSRGIDIDSLMAAADSAGILDVAGLPAAYSRVPEDAATQALPIRFVGPPSRAGGSDGAFMAVPASYAAFFPALFADKIVLLGTGFHEQDRFRSPFYQHVDSAGQMYGWTNGIEIHANALENLLTERYPAPLPGPLAVALLLSVALVVSAVTFLRGPSWGGAAAAVLVVTVLGAAVVIFIQASVHVPVVTPILAIGFAFLGSTWYISAVEGREKRLIRRAFGKYVSPAVVDQLVVDPSRLRLGGEKRNVTILFSDLAGFTSLSERTDPERLLALLNRYLDGMVEVLLDEQGTLDKYMGDAVMALFGAPVPQQDHAIRACRTALRMQKRLAELNEEWGAEGWPALRMRIGVNTGSPVVGNIGGENRFDYTALGDAVNLAARLEPACKRYGVQILISEGTRVAAGDEIVVRELDQLAVYGKSEPVRVYELLGLAGDSEQPDPELIGHFERGLAAYRRRDFELASREFAAGARVHPDDAPTALYLSRSQEYMISPPPDSWDAVERSLSK